MLSCWSMLLSITPVPLCVEGGNGLVALCTAQHIVDFLIDMDVAMISYLDRILQILYCIDAISTYFRESIRATRYSSGIIM